MHTKKGFGAQMAGSAVTLCRATGAGCYCALCPGTDGPCMYSGRQAYAMHDALHTRQEVRAQNPVTHLRCTEGEVHVANGTDGGVITGLGTAQNRDVAEISLVRKRGLTNLHTSSHSSRKVGDPGARTL